ncbi:Hypothetical protein NTJ_15507 [Nesidiocoris tenuis]|uniref:Uncharacterized protein n=1 Tax=Nesidiocoris tenuis TaxID=355587 RepID=A0ABN7BE86_9HEMI|nr:Hypothetical protein NTJ_15507 [Nesidiocoris tenuis]
MVNSSQRDVNKSSGFRQDFPDPEDGEIQIPDLLDVEENVRELDSALDQLNSALDDLEARNENIQSMLLALLNESRETSKELAAINKSSQK